jgi:hypothetical protein
MLMLLSAYTTINVSEDYKPNVNVAHTVGSMYQRMYKPEALDRVFKYKKHN